MLKRLVHYYAKALTEDSGVTASLFDWARHQQRLLGIPVLVTGAKPRSVAQQDARRSNVECVAVGHLGRERRTYLPFDMHRRLRPDDLLILHEGWTLSNRAMSAHATRLGVPYVIMPHGVYDPNIVALQSHLRIRQAIETPIIEHATAIHNFYDTETAGVRAMTLGTLPPVINVPNGITPVKGETWRGGGGYLLWMGRYDVHHKGLDRLLQAVSSMPKASRPRVRLYGFDFQGGRAVCAGLVNELQLSADVTLNGPLHGRDKVRVMLEADGYVHPSRWEASSVTLLEMMVRRVPSLVSSNIHMAHSLSESGLASMVTSTDAQPFAEGLERLMNGSIRGDAGENYVREYHDWDKLVGMWWHQIDRVVKAY